jgi:ATP-dependent Clp protease ATP-binding subunit ClpC
VTDVVSRFRAGLNDPGRPLGVLLFSGPTGTGKTQLARLAGEYLFPGRPAKDRVLRLDMSEYSGPGATSRLLGDPFGEPSDLIKRIRRFPFAVVLLDEIEKASPEIMDALMNVFDEGRLTDAMGRVTWFRSSLIILTSNLGAAARPPVGFAASGGPRSSGAAPDAIRAFFRPEMLNRIDAVVPFHALNREEIARIARAEIEALHEREGLSARGLRLRVGSRLLERVIDAGFDPLLGARPLQRQIEENIVNPLSRLLARQPGLCGKLLEIEWDGESAQVQVSG